VTSLRLQIGTFLTMIVIGIIIGIIFDFYRALRRQTAVKRIATDLGDVVFSLVAALLVCGGLIYSNNGRVRIYFLLGAGGGFSGYYLLISPLILNGLLNIFELVTRLIVNIKKAGSLVYNKFKEVGLKMKLLIIPGENQDG
jgi:spore cortex biosynthesis protein YabQ